MGNTYKKVEDESEEQKYEIATPQPASKKVVTLEELNREIAMRQSDVERALDEVSKLEAIKVELLKLS